MKSTWKLLRCADAPRALAVVLGCLALAPTPLPAQPDALTEDERNTVEIYSRASRGVVHIQAQTVLEAPFEKDVVEGSSGSGFVLDQQGRILTAYHVVSGKNQVEVILGSGLRLQARLVGTAPQIDVALLQVEAPAEELHPLPLGDSTRLAVGQKLIAIGNPIGLHNTVTVGVVSALNRSAGAVAAELQDALIQTDAAINPGNSGGPLLNSAGEVVGINDAIIERAQNLGFAIPIHLARRVIPDLIEMGHPYRPQLGFSGGEITPSIAKLFGLSLEHGFLVEEVLPNSPAAYAGLRAGSRIVVVADKAFVLGGDIITAINGEPVRTSSQIAHILLQSHPGDVLILKVHRNGQELEITIPLLKMRMQF